MRTQISHLDTLLSRGNVELTSAEYSQLEALLKEFPDIFAKSDFDFGNFKALEHEIDTGKAKPVKQRMRRTPSNFVKEEEAHLDKMLKAGVIVPSVSE